MLTGNKDFVVELKKMKIIFYCQYVWGMGHLFRSIELARALDGHDVVLVAGGREVDVELPDQVTLVRLPGLYMDEEFTTLIPDVFMIELYPFGRTIFGFELQPLLEGIRQGRFGETKVVCSLRDILVEKNR